VIEVDIVVLGAGPAGAALALTLAPRHRVLLVDRAREPAVRIGESLIPAARRLFRDMRILDALEAEGHPDYLGNLSHWGAGPVQVTDFLRDPDGPGWHLDRVRFERFLRTAAARRGARIMAPARVGQLERTARGWDLSLRAGSRTERVHGRLLVDATGRAATIAKRLGAERENVDRLTAHWLTGDVDAESSDTAGFSIVESEPEGWWYSAPLAGGTRVLAFHTDSDATPIETRQSDRLIDRAMALPGLGRVLDGIGFRPAAELAVTAANSARLSQVAGDGWLAVGDAAFSFDPLASRGLFNALYSGWSGAMAAHDYLTGAEPDFSAYAADLDRAWRLYRRQLATIYGGEPRWRDHRFWRRRIVEPDLVEGAD
jgi:flavin-dependent dehydrogenase